MTKILFTLAALIFFSCGNDEGNLIQTDSTGTPTEKPEREDPFQGYLISDSVGITNIEFRNSPKEPGAIFISGIKNGKVWYGKFDKNTKKPEFEIEDNQPFEINQTVHLGYGEYKKFKVGKIAVYDGVEANGKSCVYVAFIEKSKSPISDLYISRLDFISNGKITKSLYKRDYSPIKSPILYKWFDSIISQEGGKYNSYSLNGDLLFESDYGYWAFYYTEAYSPYSIENCIAIVTSAGITRTVSIQKINLKKELWEWSTNIGESHMNDRILNSVFNYRNGECSVSFDILSQSGDKRNIRATVNVETGEVASLN